MKFSSLVFCSLFAVVVSAQSPYLAVRLYMDSLDNTSKEGQFEIQMKICEPLQKTEKGDWFTIDSSGIDFLKLTAAEISCGRYRSEGEGNEKLNVKTETKKNYSYSFGNQHFAWENILVFRITKTSTGEVQEPMYIIMPVKYKAFITAINISEVAYQPGTLIYIDKTEPQFVKQRLKINHSLRLETGTYFSNTVFADWVN